MVKQKSFFKEIIFLAFVVLFVGAIFYHRVENLSWLDSFYFASVTLTTVGYGDIHPVTDLGKIFTIFYVFMGIGIIFSLINEIANRRIRRIADRKNK